MKKIVIDNNIIFAALRGQKSLTRNKILSSRDTYFCPNIIAVKIFKHKVRILNNTKLTEDEILDFSTKMLNKIIFINEENISITNFIEAYHLCKDIDEKVTRFVALSLELGFELWTRDQELKDGLKAKGFNQFYDENDYENTIKYQY